VYGILVSRILKISRIQGYAIQNYMGVGQALGHQEDGKTSEGTVWI